MAIIGVDIGSSNQVINAGNFNQDNDVLRLNVLGQNTLTVDGVNATANTLVGVQTLGNPTYEVINGGSLTINSGLANLSALSGLNYKIADGSAITVNAPTAAAGLITSQNIEFTGNGGGAFNYIPGTVNLGASPTFTVSSLGTGDSLSVAGRSNGVFTYNAGAQTGTLTYAGHALNGGTVTYRIEDLSQEDYNAIIAANGGSNTGFGQFVSPVCFLRGTMILTPEGEVAIEALQPGDKVIGASGVREVKWVGYRKTVTRSIPAEHRVDHMPIRICRNAISDNVPSKDIVVSPGHHILFEGKLIRAKDIVNDRTIYQETQLTSYEYFHVELDQFDVISAHGLMSESWADGGNRDYFQNVDVTTLLPQDIERRKANRPGFDALRKAKDIAPLHAKLAKRADEILDADLKTKAA